MNKRLAWFTKRTGHEIAVRPILYYILNFTWGLPLTLLGFLLTLIFLIFGAKIRKHNYTYFVVLPFIPRLGFSVGITWFVGYLTADRLEVQDHEYGHTVQNALFGPFMFFIVSLPSVIRWWYRHFKIKKGLRNSLPNYYNIWFEGSASDIGELYGLSLK